MQDATEENGDMIKKKIGKLGVLHRLPKEESTGIVAFLVHGMLEGPWAFDQWAKWLQEKGVESYAISLRGEKENPRPNIGQVSIMEYVRNVKEVIDQVILMGTVSTRNKKRYILIGHSLGGLIAQKIVETDHRIDRAILVTSAPPFGIRLRGEVFRRLWGWKYILAMLFNGPLKTPFHDALALGLNKVSDPESIYNELFPESGRVAFELLMGSIAVDASKITCPMMVIGCSHDNLMPAKIQRYVAQKYNAIYEEYPDHAHMPMIEKGWQNVIQDIYNFVES